MEILPYIDVKNVFHVFSLVTFLRFDVFYFVNVLYF